MAVGIQNRQLALYGEHQTAGGGVGDRQLAAVDANGHAGAALAILGEQAGGGEVVGQDAAVSPPERQENGELGAQVAAARAHDAIAQTIEEAGSR